VTLRLTTLGPLELSVDGDVDAAFATRRVRAALLVYLAAEGRRSRDQVMNLLWGDRPEDRARHVLNQTLYEIRRDLGAEVVESRGTHLRLGDDVEADVVELREAAESDDHVRVIALYRGHFLDGFFVPEAREFAEWADRTARELRQLHFRSYEGHVDALAGEGDTEAALEAARAWARWHPEAERPRFTSARLLLRSGRRDEARREYERWQDDAPRTRGRPPDAALWKPLLDELAARGAPRPSAGEAGEAGGKLTVRVSAGGARGPRLVLLGEPGQEEVYRLSPGENVIGSEEGALRFPENRALSGRHAAIVVEEKEGGGARCVLRDLESRGGTYLRISGARPLADGEVFLAGQQVFQLRRRR